MNAGLMQAWREIAETFDQVTWVPGDEVLNDQTPRVLVRPIRDGEQWGVLEADNSAHQFYHALGIALGVIAELNAALLTTQDVASAAIDRAIEQDMPHHRATIDSTFCCACGESWPCPVVR